MHLRRLLVATAGVVLALGCSGGGTKESDDGGVVKLSQLGESCGRSADCAGDLICLGQQCAAAGTTTTPPAAPKVSGRGESCASSVDCGTGLVCWPIKDQSSTTFTGRCDFSSFGVTATGKTCSAECLTNADCLEIPIPDQPGTLPDGGSTVYRSCQDLTKAIGGDSCAEAGSTRQRECFLFRTYCDSVNNPWTCTSGACVFSGTCSGGKSGEVIGGCPSYTRTGTALAVTTCNSAGKCAASSVAGCTSDPSCDGKPVADEPDTDTCSSGECVCHAASGGCYRRCKNNLECEKGYVCSTASYCVPADSCDTDAFCALATGRASAKCVTGRCKVPCAIDLQCSASGLSLGGTPFVGEVCHAGYCESVGCSSDAECAVSSAGRLVRTFCVTPPAASTTATPHSAITN